MTGLIKSLEFKHLIKIMTQNIVIKVWISNLDILLTRPIYVGFLLYALAQQKGGEISLS